MKSDGTAELIGGRVGLASASASVSKVALAITVRYSLQRRQFGPAGNESYIMDYPLHQMRIIPLIASTYALVTRTGIG